MYSIDNSVASGSTAKNRLKGNAIHTVKFIGAEAVDLKDGEYKTVQLTFENEEGQFVDTIFEPKPEDGERKPNSFGGVNPSGFEELTGKIRHLIAAVNPELNKKIDDGTQPLTAKNWDGFRKLIIASVAKGVGKEVQIKLINNGKGEARFPTFVLAISKTGNLYMRTNFIGDNLQFTKKEEERIAASAETPTNMNSGYSSISLEDTDGETKGGDDLDFDLEDL